MSSFTRRAILAVTADMTGKAVARAQKSGWNKLAQSAGSSRKYVMARSMNSGWHLAIFSGFQGGSAAHETAKRVWSRGGAPQLHLVEARRRAVGSKSNIRGSLAAKHLKRQKS